MPFVIILQWKRGVRWNWKSNIWHHKCNISYGGWYDYPTTNETIIYPCIRLPIL